MDTRKREGTRTGIPNGISLMKDSKMVRVPSDLVDDVKKMIKDWKQERIDKIKGALKD